MKQSLKKCFIVGFILFVIVNLDFTLISQREYGMKRLNAQVSTLLNISVSTQPEFEYGLNFIHIPKTAGTFIEFIGEKSNIEWGMKWFNKRMNKYDWTQITSGTLCKQHYHEPPRIFNKTFEYYANTKHKLFCIIRNPYSRMLSEYLWYIWWNKYDNTQNIDILNDITYCNENVMNEIINDWLRKAIKEQQKKELFYSNQECHLLPQYLYVFDNNENKICDYVININNLIPTLTKLFDDYNLQINLKNEAKKQTQKLCTKHNLSISNFTDETIYNINTLYDKDFLLLNFTKIKLNRTLQNEQIWIENAGFKYREYYSDKYPANHSIIKNHKNKCKISEIENNGSIFHIQKEKILPYKIGKKNSQPRRRQHTEINNVNSDLIVILCVRLRNELRYLFEWIEYHHFIQKIDYIFILNHFSVDRLHDLLNMYNNPWWLKIFDIKNEWDAYTKCRVNAITIAKQHNIYERTYVGLWDVDEFIYAIKYDNIKQYLANNHIYNHIKIKLIGFGTYTDDAPFMYDIDNTNKNSVKMINGNQEGIKTVIGRYLYRGPHPRLDPKHIFQNLRATTDCSIYKLRGNSTSINSSTCDEGRTMIKSITKISDCLRLDTHFCRVWKNSTKIKSTDKGILGHHYLYRFHQSFFQRDYGWRKYDKWVALFSNVNDKYFNAIYDASLANRYHKNVTQRLYNLLNCNTTKNQLIQSHFF